MESDKVIELAKRYAERNGYEPHAYEISAQRENSTWSVRFEGREKRPGNFLTVYIDDRTGELRDFFPGK